MLSADQALAKAVVLYDRLRARRPEIVDFEAYHRGEQPLAFASEEWAKFHKSRYRDFADNWCGVVGSAPAERMGVIGFRIGDDMDTMSDDEKVLWRDWELNEGSAQSSQGFLTSTIAKRSFAMVWGDRDDNPVLTWEHPAQVLIDYDPENPRIKRFMVKSWSDGDDEFLTLFEPDAVWKWQRKTAAGIPSGQQTESGLTVVSSWSFGAAGWKVRQPASDDTWPIANPLVRIPGAEFANRPQLGGAPVSDIAGTRAMQNAVNLLWAYMFTAADYASMPARVVLGQSPPKIPILDESGQKIGERPVDSEALSKGRMLYLTGQNTKIDQWDAAKLDVFTDVINIAVRHIAAQTRTPIYLIHGELGNVNGETLTGLDAPLVSKVREAQKFHRQSVREVFSLMAAVRGNSKVSEAARLGDVAWMNPEVRSDSQVSDAALKDVQIGWPLEAVLENRYGLPQIKIDRIMGQIASQTDPYLATVNTKDAATQSEV